MNSNLMMESNNRPTLLSMLATTTESIDIVDRSLLILRSKDRRTLLENSCLGGGSGGVGNVHHCDCMSMLMIIIMIDPISACFLNFC